MSSDAIITVEGLGKRYRLGAKGGSGERYTALRDVVAEAAAKPFRSLRDKFKSKNGSADLSSTSTSNFNSRTEEFWALKDVSFEVKRGEVLGIIGRNGAGKSTLLKILSRITDPTEGRITIKGRVASLLEVGTGFHPELTGRENIYLNGAILGMHRSEIKSKFDEIVAFAEIERFLDTPVKRYSSGMYVRLAFAVAAHLEPEILVVDEVLAVGDAEFQKKCLGKMEQVAKGQGRAILFVSHNMGAIRRLCHTGMILAGGETDGPRDIEEAIRLYRASSYLTDSPPSKEFQYIKSASVRGPEGQVTDAVFFGERLEIRISLRKLPEVRCALNLLIYDDNHEVVSLFSTAPHDGISLPLRMPELELSFQIPEVRFAPGTYYLACEVTEPTIRVLERTDIFGKFDVAAQPLFGDWAYDRKYGRYFPSHTWTINGSSYKR